MPYAVEVVSILMVLALVSGEPLVVVFLAVVMVCVMVVVLAAGVVNFLVAGVVPATLPAEPSAGASSQAPAAPPTCVVPGAGTTNMSVLGPGWPHRVASDYEAGVVVKESDSIVETYMPLCHC